MFSTIKILGTACSNEQEGSGFVVAPGLVVTNAHVVAGESDGNTQVIVGDNAYSATRGVSSTPRSTSPSCVPTRRSVRP